MTRRKADADARNTVLSMLLVLLLADLFLPYQIDFLYARWAIHLVTCATHHHSVTRRPRTRASRTRISVPRCAVLHEAQHVLLLFLTCSSQHQYWQYGRARSSRQARALS